MSKTILIRTMSFDEYIELINNSNDSDVMRGGLGDNETILTNLTPLQIKEGLLKTGKFLYSNLNPEAQGIFHVAHPLTNTILLVKYWGEWRDRETGNLLNPHAKNAYFTIHPNQFVLPVKKSATNYAEVYRKILPDIYEFGKTANCYLKASLGFPGRKNIDDFVLVEFSPKTDLGEKAE